MSESDPHDLPEPFDPLEHLGPLEGDSPSPLDDLDLGGLTDHDSDPFGAEHAAPAPAGSHFVPSPEPEPVVKPMSARPTTSTPPRVSMSRKPSAVPVLATVLGTAAVMLGGAFALSKLMPPPPPPATAPAAAPTASAAPASLANDETKTLASKLDGEVKDLVARVDGLQKQLTAMPKPAPAPDLGPIEARLDALAKKADTPAPTPTTDVKALEDKVARTSDALADLSKKIDAIGDRAAAMEKTLDADKSALSALQDKIKDLSESKPAPASAVAATPMPAPARTAPANPAPSTPEAVPAANEAEMAKAIDLFKKGQYPQARDAFARLRQSVPNDAIVWYYSAVTNGFATGVWTGETDQLVTRGLELEKSGSPDASKINAAFADLSPSVKGWLDAYRARIVR